MPTWRRTFQRRTACAAACPTPTRNDGTSYHHAATLLHSSYIAQLYAPTAQVLELTKNAGGAHGKPVELHLGRLWSSNITLTTRLVDYHNADAAQLVEARRLDAKKLVSHRFTLAGIMRANHIFGNAAAEHALKVILNSAN